MAAVLLICQVALAVVFTLSAVSKLHDRREYASFRKSLPLTLPIAERFAGVVAVAVVAAEILAALLLLAGMADPALALAGFGFAFLLTFAFTVAIGLMLLRGVTEPCHCFGTTSSRPPGQADLWRNLTMLAVAVLGGLSSRMSAGGDAMAYPQMVVVLGVALGVFNAVVVVVILKQLRTQSELLRASVLGEVEQSSTMLEANAAVGKFAAVTEDGEAISKGDLRGLTLVSFLSPSCAACEESLPGFILRAREHGRGQVLAVVVGEHAETSSLRERLSEVARVVAEPEQGPLTRAFKVAGFPAFALLSDDVVVGSHFVLNRLPETV